MIELTTWPWSPRELNDLWGIKSIRMAQLYSVIPIHLLAPQFFSASETNCRNHVKHHLRKSLQNLCLLQFFLNLSFCNLQLIEQYTFYSTVENRFSRNHSKPQVQDNMINQVLFQTPNNKNQYFWQTHRSCQTFSSKDRNLRGEKQGIEKGKLYIVFRTPTRIWAWIQVWIRYSY